MRARCLARRARADARRADRPPAADSRGPGRRRAAARGLPALWPAAAAIGWIRDDGPADRPRPAGHRAGPGRRRRLFEALEPLWRTVDGDGGDASPYRELLTASAERWARDGSPIEATRALGHARRRRSRRCSGDPRRPGASVVGPAASSLGLSVRGGAAERRLDALVPRRAPPADQRRVPRAPRRGPEALGIGYDLLPGPGDRRSPSRSRSGAGARGGGPGAAAVGLRDVREGGLGNLDELLHESGHALHKAAIRTRPAFFDCPLDDERVPRGHGRRPRLGRRRAGLAAPLARRGRDPREALLDRYGAVMLDVCWALFEIELHRHPDRRPNDVWAEIAADGLGIEPHPEWSWWAIRGQLIELPGLDRQLRAVGDRGGRGPGPDARGPRGLVDGRSGLVSVRVGALFAAGAAVPGGPARGASSAAR